MDILGRQQPEKRIDRLENSGLRPPKGGRLDSGLRGHRSQGSVVPTISYINTKGTCHIDTNTKA